VCGLNDGELEKHLNTESGLLGLGGSSDIRELLEREAAGDTRAQLALSTYIHSVQKTIGQMAGVLDGADAIVFTGTVGERSAPIRGRVIEKLHYLSFVLDETANKNCTVSKAVTDINHAGCSPIWVVAANEADEMARRLHYLS
jgi:acetate kinase